MTYTIAYSPKGSDRITTVTRETAWEALILAEELEKQDKTIDFIDTTDGRRFDIETLRDLASTESERVGRVSGRD